MWDLVSLLAAMAALSWIMGFWGDPERAMEQIGRLGAALRRGYRGETAAPPAPPPSETP